MPAVRFLATSCLLLCSGVAVAGPNWGNWGGGSDNARNASTEHHIGVDNVADLAVAWTFTAGSDISSTPVVQGDDVYFTDWGGYLYSLDAETGATNWSVAISDLTGIEGDFSRTSPAVHGNSLILGNRTIGAATLISVNRNTGALEWATSLSDHYAAIVTQSPTVHGNTVFAGLASMEEAIAGDGDVPVQPVCTHVHSQAAATLWRS